MMLVVVCALGLLPVPLLPSPMPQRLPQRLPPRVARIAMDAEVDETFNAQKTVPNELQQQAIRSNRDAVLLLAPPGTGKTRVLRARLAYLLNKGVESSSILAVTFTNHAAQQLKMRVGALADSNIEGVWTGTFHSVCARMLRQNAALVNLAPAFVVLVETQQIALLAELMGQVGMKRGAGSTTPSPSAVLHRIQCWKESGLKPSEVPAAGVRGVAGDDAVARSARALYPEYQRRLRTRGQLDYADLALGCLKLFEQHPAVLLRYRAQLRHVLVDELQDTSAVQYEWLRRLTGQRAAGRRTGSCLFAAADDDQSIYGWRGAARDNVLRFSLDWPEAEVIRMAQSYRCSGNVLASALPLLQHACSLSPKTPFTRLAPAARVLLRGFWDSTEEGAWIAAQIASRVAAGQAPSTIAVLVRSQEQARMLLPHLVAAGLPVAMQPQGATRGAWWEAPEVVSAVHALRLVRSTADNEAAKELLRAWGGLSAACVDTLERVAEEQQCSLLNTAARALQHRRLPPSAVPRLVHFFARFAHWQALAGSGGLQLVLGAVAADHAGWCTDGGTSMQKLVHFASRCGSLDNMLQHSAFSGRGAAHTVPAGQGGSARRSAAAPPPGASGGGAASDGGSISLLTIHRSKGLEWDVVFLPGWEEGTFPLIPSNGALDEEWRLAYVALTRAKQFAGISHASRRNWHGRWLHRSPSNFLQVLPSSSVASFAPNIARPYYQGKSSFRATQSMFFNQRRIKDANAQRVSSAFRSPPAERAPQSIEPAVEIHATHSYAAPTAERWAARSAGAGARARPVPPQPVQSTRSPQPPMESSMPLAPQLQQSLTPPLTPPPAPPLPQAIPQQPSMPPPPHVRSTSPAADLDTFPARAPPQGPTSLDASAEYLLRTLQAKEKAAAAARRDVHIGGIDVSSAAADVRDLLNGDRSRAEEASSSRLDELRELTSRRDAARAELAAARRRADELRELTSRRDAARAELAAARRRAEVAAAAEDLAAEWTSAERDVDGAGGDPTGRDSELLHVSGEGGVAHAELVEPIDVGEAPTELISPTELTSYGDYADDLDDDLDDDLAEPTDDELMSITVEGLTPEGLADGPSITWPLGEMTIEAIPEVTFDWAEAQLDAQVDAQIAPPDADEQELSFEWTYHAESGIAVGVAPSPAGTPAGAAHELVVASPAGEGAVDIDEASDEASALLDALAMQVGALAAANTEGSDWI